MTEIKTEKPLKPIRVAISIPAGDEVKLGFANDLALMMTATVLVREDVDLRLHFVKGTILPKSREGLAFMALEQDYTHMLFLDSDMRFPRNTLLRLLARNAYVVGANYSTRRYPCRPVTFADDTDAENRVYTEEGADGLQEVASIGLGVALIDLDIFKALPRPWFATPFDEESRHFVGEDVYFCRKVRDHLNLPILVDHGLSQEVGHVGEWVYRLDHARALRDEAPENTPAAPLVVAP